MDNNFNTPQNDFNQTTVNNDSMQPNSNPYVQSNDAAFTQQANPNPYVQQNEGAFTQQANVNPYSQPVNNNPYAQQNINNTYSQQNANPYQSTPYQNTPYGTQYNAAPQQKQSTDVFGIISLVCGILSIIFCCCCNFLSIVLGIAAIILAIVSKSNSADSKFSGIALGGLICGIVGLTIGIIVTIIALCSPDAWEAFEEIFEEL